MALQVATPTSGGGLTVKSAGGVEGNTIVAIVENTRFEVGLAVCSLEGLPCMSLCQVSDDKLYSKAMPLIDSLETKMIITCTNARKGSDASSAGIIGKIERAEHRPLSIEAISRKYFNECDGLRLLRDLAVPEDQVALDKEIRPLFLALASACALIQFCRFRLGLLFSTKFPVRLLNPNGFMLIDSASLFNLEVLRNSKTQDMKHCLFGMLNYCKTKGGQRLLRATLRMPLRDLPSLVARQQCIAELLESKRVFERTGIILSNLSDMDGVLRELSRPTTNASQSPQSWMVALARLRRALSMAVELRDALTNDGAFHPRSSITITCMEQLNHPDMLAAMADIDAVINAEVSTAKQHLSPCDVVRLVKSDPNSMLSHTKSVWEAAYGDMHELLAHYRKTLDCPAVSLQHSSRRGYVLKMPAAVKDDLPSDTFTHVARSGAKHITCSTGPLAQLNFRMSKVFEDIVSLGNQAVDKLIKRLRERMWAMHLLSESVSLLDMVHALAEFTSLSPNYVFPDLVSRGPLVIKRGRHCLLEKYACSEDDVVANDTYLSASKNFLVLTGPNMSGKSTLMQQTLLIVMLAQIGCPVPAQFASIPLFDRLFSRHGASDCLESNASTFAIEMVETAFIAQALEKEPNANVLVAFDELGRGTSHVEGCAVAWATSEFLTSRKNAFTIFATHFLELQKLAELLPGVRCMTMSVARDPATDTVSMLHQVKNGVLHREDYMTLHLARKAGFPRDVLTTTETLLQKLLQSHDELVVCCRGQGGAHDLVEKLRNLQLHSTVDDATLRVMLLEIQGAARAQCTAFDNAPLGAHAVGDPTGP